MLQITDVSNVFCPDNYHWAVEKFVESGTRCAQGIHGVKVDSIESVPAMTTRTYFQWGPVTSYTDEEAKPSSTLDSRPTCTPRPHGPCPTVKFGKPHCTIDDKCIRDYGRGFESKDLVDLCGNPYCDQIGLPQVEQETCEICFEELTIRWFQGKGVGTLKMAETQLRVQAVRKIECLKDM